MCAQTPVFVGSGVTVANVESYVKEADGIIVGSTFKEDGRWQNKVSLARTKEFMDKVKSVRGY